MSESLKSYGVFTLIVVAFGGLLFGYYTGVISGALIFLAKDFTLTDAQQGYLVAVLLLGGLLGSLLAGPLADRLGRKKSLLLMAFLSLLGSWWLTTATDYTSFLWGRVICGIAAGIVCVATPMSLAEMAPPRYRGRCVSLFQLMISLGVLVSYGVSFIYAQAEAWRPLFAIGTFLSLVQLVTLVFIPESPAWLLARASPTRAARAWSQLRGDTSWKKEMEQFQNTPRQTNQWLLCFKPLYFAILCICLVLNVFQQITGINAVIYYTPRIFSEMGIDSSFGMFMATLVVGLINVLSTLLSAWLLDKAGRRRLLIIGSSGMTVSLTVLSIVVLERSYFNDAVACVSLISYVAFFAMSLGPVTWVVLSEILPLSIRSVGMALALVGNWLANYVVCLTFPDLIHHLGVSGSFALFGSLSLLALLFVFCFIPETKGKTLEEIETMVKSRKLK